jgi:hypothetical protein
MSWWQVANQRPPEPGRSVEAAAEIARQQETNINQLVTEIGGVIPPA